MSPSLRTISSLLFKAASLQWIQIVCCYCCLDWQLSGSDVTMHWPVQLEIINSPVPVGAVDILCSVQRRSQDLCLGGGTRYIFRHLSGSRPHSVGGGVVADIFLVHKSITFPRFRDIFGTFPGPPANHPPFTDTHGNSGTLPRSAYTFKPRNNINSFQKKTFTKSWGGHGPLAPLATPLARFPSSSSVYKTIVHKDR